MIDSGEMTPRVLDESRAARRLERRRPLIRRLRTGWYYRRGPEHDGIPAARYGRPDVLPIVLRRNANAAQCALAAGAAVTWHGVGIAEVDPAGICIAEIGTPWVERRGDGRREVAGRDPALGTSVLIDGPPRCGPLTLSGGVVMP
jgi:hypothetical protein